MSDGGEVVTGPWNDNVVNFEVNPNGEIAARGDIYDELVKIVKIESPVNAFLRRFEELSDEALEVVRKKNNDYANQDQPFANFETAPLVGVSVPRGFLVRMQDKLQRISNLLDRPAAVADESILDSIKDLRNYAQILCIWLEQNSDGNLG